MDDGITFKSSPWAWSVKYAWHDVVGVTVLCDYVPGRYGGNHNSLTLAITNGAETNLFETARSFSE